MYVNNGDEPKERTTTQHIKMTGRRTKTDDRGGGLVSQRIGLFEKSKRSPKSDRTKSTSISPKLSSRRRAYKDKVLPRTIQEDQAPILDWSLENTSPRHRALARNESSSNAHYSTIFSAMYGENTSSAGTETTDVKIDHFLDHIKRLECQDEMSLGVTSGLSRYRAKKGQKSTPTKSKPHRSLNKSPVRQLEKDNEELDTLVLVSSSSNSNGATEWFQNLIDDSASLAASSASGASGKKGERRVRWRPYNQEHQVPPNSAAAKRRLRKAQQATNSKSKQSIIEASSHSWDQQSVEYGNFFRGNNPDSSKKKSPSSKKQPKAEAASDDWDFNQQIFPKLSSSSSSFSDEFPPPKKLPSRGVRTDSTSKKTKRGNEDNKSLASAGSIDSRSSGGSRVSSNASQTHALQRRIKARALSPNFHTNTAKDPPTVTLSLQDSIRKQSTRSSRYMEQSSGSSDQEDWMSGDHISNLQPVSSSSSQLDPDGILFDTNSPDETSDESAIHNQLVQKKGMAAQHLRHEPGKMQSTSYENSPRSTWIPVTPPLVLDKQELKMSRDPSPEKTRRGMKTGEQNKFGGARSSSSYMNKSDDESSVFSDILSIDQHSTISGTSRRSAQLKADSQNLKAGRYAPSSAELKQIGSKASLGSTQLGIKASNGSQYSCSDSRQKEIKQDVSLFDMVSEDSESVGMSSRLTETESQNDNNPQIRHQHTHRKSGNLSEAASHSQSLGGKSSEGTPLADNRTRDFRIPPPRSSKNEKTRRRASGDRSSSAPAGRSTTPTPSQQTFARSTKTHISQDSGVLEKSINGSRTQEEDVPFHNFDGINASRTQDRSNTARNHGHAPFTSVRETVATNRTSSSKKKTGDIRKSTSAIAVGQEIDGHRPFTSVRGTVASSTDSYGHFQESAADLFHRKDSQSEEISKENQAASSQRNNGHARDYWKSITTIKSLGSFDSLSAINDPNRRARKSQEFVDREKDMEGPVKTMKESLSNWHEQHMAREEQKLALAASEEAPPLSPFCAGKNGDNKTFSKIANGEEGIECTRSSVAPGNSLDIEDDGLVDVDLGVESPAVDPTMVNPASSGPRQRAYSVWNTTKNFLPSYYGSMGTSPQRQQQQQHQHHQQQTLQQAQNSTGRKKSGRRVRVASPNTSNQFPAAQEAPSQNTWRSPQQYFNAPLMSRDSEDTVSTEEDQTISILDGGTTVVEPPAACCSFTIGDLSWGFEWLRPSKHD